jgi:type IV pilus assembly protein PilO
MSRRLKLILVGVGIVAVALLVYFLLLSPMRGEVSDLNLQVDQENTKIAAAQQQLSMAETTRSEGRRNEARLIELAKMIPDASEIPSLILQIQDLADKAGISWIQVSPSEAKPIEGLAYSIIPLSCSFSGSFYDVSDFVYRAEQMAAGPGRLLAVKDVSFTPDVIKGGGKVPYSVTLTVRMTVYAFVMVDTSAQSAPAAASSPNGESDGVTTTTMLAQ